MGVFFSVMVSIAAAFDEDTLYVLRLCHVLDLQVAGPDTASRILDFIHLLHSMFGV